MSSADNLCKQFGHRSGLTECRSWSGSKLFDTLIVLLKEFFEKGNFEKKSAGKYKSMKNYPACRASLNEKPFEKMCEQSKDQSLLSTQWGAYKDTMIFSHQQHFAPWEIFSRFFVVCWLFSKSTFSKNSFKNTIWVSNRLDPDQVGHSDLGPICLQKLSADDTSS